MSISDKDLLLAILAMDSYNRGYAAGIGGLSDDKGAAIGNATIATRIQNVSDTFEDEAKDAGFYAVSYDVPDIGTVISSRCWFQKAVKAQLMAKQKKEGDLRIHPLITRLVDPETLKKMGAAPVSKKNEQDNQPLS